MKTTDKVRAQVSLLQLVSIIQRCIREETAIPREHVTKGDWFFARKYVVNYAIVSTFRVAFTKRPVILLVWLVEAKAIVKSGGMVLLTLDLNQDFCMRTCWSDINRLKWIYSTFFEGKKHEKNCGFVWRNSRDWGEILGKLQNLRAFFSKIIDFLKLNNLDGQIFGELSKKTPYIEKVSPPKF